MTPSTSGFATLAADIFFTSLAAPVLAQAHAPSPCALITLAQIKAVVDTPVQPGKPGTGESNGTADCTWPDAKGETRVYIALKDPTDFKALRDSMQATGKLVPITGLSSDAFFVHSAGTSAALYALKGKHLLLLTVDGVGYTRAQNEEAEKALATETLPKL